MSLLSLGVVDSSFLIAFLQRMLIINVLRAVTYLLVQYMKILPETLFKKLVPVFTLLGGYSCIHRAADTRELSVQSLKKNFPPLLFLKVWSHDATLFGFFEILQSI
jgi:hypothetical protein